MQNNLYTVLKQTGEQLDIESMTLASGVVTEVETTDGTAYSGLNVRIFTDRDFLYVPDLDQSLSVGDQIYLDNQSLQRWVVCKGWYSVDDNPPIWGWYLQSIPAGKIRSLFLKDFNSLTMVTPRTEFTLPTLVPDSNAG